MDLSSRDYDILVNEGKREIARKREGGEEGETEISRSFGLFSYAIYTRKLTNSVIIGAFVREL